MQFACLNYDLHPNQIGVVHNAWFLCHHRPDNQNWTIIQKVNEP